MDAQPLVQLLAVAAAADGFHHDVLGREKRDLGLEPAARDFGVHDQPAEDVLGEHEDRVGREERLGHRDALVGRIVERPLEPLGRGRHRGVDRERDDVARERAHALGPHGVALVGHGRGADLRRLERLFDLALVLQQSQVGRGLVGGLRDPREGVDDEVVLLARVGLARDALAAVEARAAGEGRVELLDLLGIPSEEREEGRLRARGSLGPEEAEALRARRAPARDR